MGSFCGTILLAWCECRRPSGYAMQDILADEISQKVSAIVNLHSESSRAFAFENFTDTSGNASDSS